MARQDWPTNGEIVEVEWVDSATTAGWHTDIEDGDGLVECRTAGYMLSKDRTSVKIIQSQTSHGANGEMIAIPRTCVRSIKRLTRPK